MKYRIHRAAIIGSGTMGGGIAALLAGLGIPTLLYDIVPNELTPAEEAAGLTLEDREVRNRIVDSGWKAVTKSRPPALLSKASEQLIGLVNLEDDFDRLAEVDLIIEVIVENLKIKRELYKRIDKIRADHTIVATNTSGLPIKALAKGMSAGFQGHFLGMHFFNPPRWLKLLEVIPHEGTLPEVLEFVISFSEDVLGKGVVICKDTPNFIANRMFSITNAHEVAYALDQGYSIEEIDAIMGVLVGRPKTGIFRLRDLIGNDVAAHVGSNLYDLIDGDETRDVLMHEASVKMLTGMVEREWLGNKTKVGFYKRVDQADGSKEFWVLNPQTMEHETPKNPRFDFFKEGREVTNLGERFAWFRAQAESDQATEENRRLARYIYETTLFSLGYASRRVPEIANRFIEIDQAMKWGFANEIGPFEIWDGLGVEATVAEMRAREIEVAGWVDVMLEAGCESFYQRKDGQVVGYYDLARKGYLPMKVDQRILPIERLKADEKAILKRNASASLIDMGDKVGLIEFHSTANALDQDIFDLMSYALDQAEDDVLDALVIGNQGQHFCAGANIFLIWMAAQGDDFGQIDTMVAGLQDILMRIRYFPKPIVAAPHGMTLGGGAELSMVCAKRVAAAETFIGLVEMGVGVIPAGTGTKEMIRRVINPVMRIENADPISVMQKVFEQIALAKVATGAWEAFEMGFFQPGDRIVMKKEHLLAEAKRSALAMVQEGYKPPARERVYAAGRDVLAALKAAVWGLREAGWATEHDAVIANQIAWVLCGGDLTDPTWVTEEYVLELERKAFITLCHEQKTIDRLGHMLQHNKPLRN
ncbi:MAG: 3-hydroxyacyl-CoA dehydrogenase/enoyl-CoA hydratase family protein [Anaerolineales bacterium]|nr:MAG: 3-hydroxyacyl-CoA dehydrogenase/enoyl-CoA hydratase family protein [Anaerolineales bacterium]